MFRKAFRYRLYPNKTQEVALTIQFGHARFVYNWGLATRKDYYREHGENLSYYALKRQPDYAWLKDADSQVTSGENRRP